MYYRAAELSENTVSMALKDLPLTTYVYEVLQWKLYTGTLFNVLPAGETYQKK